jgi:hypothetical protein
MKPTSKAVLVLALCGAASAFAQLPVSRTTSVVAVPVVASTPEFVGLPLHAEPVFRGTVTRTSGNTLNVTGTVPGLAANTAVAKVISGPSRGRYFTISASTASSVTLTGFSGSGVSLTDNVDEIEVIPLWTLGTLPIDNLTNGEEGDPGSGDKVLVLNGGVATTYYLAEEGTGWLTEVGDTPSNSVVIPFNSAIAFTAVGTKTIYVGGVLPTGPALRESAAGVRAGVALPVGQSLTLADLESRVAVGELGDPGSGDQVLLFTGGVTLTVYFAADDNEWHNVTNDAVVPDTTAIDSGSGFVITSLDNAPLSFE